MNNTIFLIIGESGSGKTSVVSELESKYNLKTVISYTTRPKRFLNEEGHYFVTDDEFLKLIDICAYSKIQGFQYGATREQIENSDIYVIDVDGIEYFKEHYTGNKKIKVIYIDVPRVDRYLRMTKRGDSPETALARLHNDDITFINAYYYADHVVSNKLLSQCVAEIENYMNKYKVMVKENV